jgi:polar amino acid transport system substrate-binding protein
VDFRIAEAKLGDLQKIATPIAYEELVVFSVNKRFKVAGYRSLQPYSIGYLLGSRIFEEKLKGMSVDTAPNLESLFNKLQAGRTDIAVDSRASFCRARKLGLTKVTILEPSLEKLLANHWVSRRHAALIPRLEAVLKKMKQDGAIKKIQEGAWKDFTAQCGA